MVPLGAPNDGPNDAVSRLDGVVVASHLSAFVESRFQKIARKILLASFADVERDFSPHVGDENNVPHCPITTKCAEQVVSPSRNPAKLIVRDPVDVYDPGELKSLFISVEEFSSGD